MSITDFVKLETENLANFQKYWLENIRTTPDDFPAFLDNTAEWGEQYFAWRELQGKDE